MAGCLRFLGAERSVRRDRGSLPPAQGPWPIDRALLACSSASKDAELLVLRTEVGVPWRQDPKPGVDWADRMVIVVQPRLLPGLLRRSRLVTPDTLMRWHRRLVRANSAWGYKRIQG